MAGKQLPGEGLSANLAGLTKGQLYEIMVQMKTLIEQNHQQARQILIQNPLLTKALFQAQIMLGMMQPPQVSSNVQQTTPQHPQQSAQPIQQSNVPTAPPLQSQGGLPDQTSVLQNPNVTRKQHQIQPVMPVTSGSVPPSNFPPQSLPSHSSQSVQQPKGLPHSQSIPISLPQASQISNIPPLPLHSSLQQPPPLQTPLSSTPNQLQQAIHTSGITHLPLQPPLPPQPRPTAMPSFSHQMHPQMGPNVGFQHSGAPPVLHSQPIFHSGLKPPPSMGPPFAQGQPPPQSLYQVGGSHLVGEFNQAGSSMQNDRGPVWMPGLQENTPGPPPFASGQMGPGNQPPRPQSLTPEMEKALLQQVMSLTPEQINLLPPEQRNQVLQLQQMLRQ